MNTEILHYSLFSIHLSEAIYGDERISTGILNPDKRAVEWHHYKSHNLKITDNNKTVLAAA
jgi:hypothetical protein